MATTMSSKIASIERDCLGMVSVLNTNGFYREGMQVQSLLQTIESVRTSLEQGDPSPGELDYPAKS